MGITTDAFSDTRIVEKRGRLRTHRIAVAFRWGS